MSKPLSEDAVARFKEEGYTQSAEFFSPREIDAMRAELDRFFQEGLIRNVATDGDGETHSKSQHNLQICPITPKSTFYRSLAFHPRVCGAISQLIGDPFVFYLDQIFLKPARSGIGTNWHQDNAYFKILDPTKGTAMWCALHDATVDNGTIHVVPRSHLEAYPHGRDPFSDHHIRCNVAEDRAVPIEIPAGGAAFFNYGIAHCTRANNSSSDRAGLALHFLRTDYIPDQATRHYTHVTGPESTGGCEEYGTVVDGTWPREVDRVLTA